MTPESENIIQPTAEELDKAMRAIMARNMECFVANIETAQRMWQSHRALVEADELPAYLEAWLDYDAKDPPIPTDEALAALALTPEEEQDSVARARAVAQAWAKQRHKAAAALA